MKRNARLTLPLQALAETVDMARCALHASNVAMSRVVHAALKITPVTRVHNLPTTLLCPLPPFSFSITSRVLALQSLRI